MSGWLGGLAASAMAAATTGNPEALLAMFLVATLTELGVPFPLVIDSVLFVLGAELLELWPSALAVVLMLMAGREVGGGVAYWLCRLATIQIGSRLSTRLSPLRRALARLASKLGGTPAIPALSRLGIQSSSLLASSGVHLSYTVAVARITPGVLTATSALFGIIGLPYRYFALGIALASVFADIAIITLGAVGGYALARFGIYLSPWFIVVGAGVNILLVWWLSRLLWGRSNSAKSPRPASAKAKKEWGSPHRDSPSFLITCCC